MSFVRAPAGVAGTWKVTMFSFLPNYVSLLLPFLSLSSILCLLFLKGGLGLHGQLTGFSGSGQG